MIQCLHRVIETYLDNYGWSYKVGGCGGWITGFQGGERSYPLFINITETWITFNIRPFIGISTDWEYWPEVLQFLLKLNNRCSMVKLVIDDDNCISLLLEIFARDLSYSEFYDSLGVLGYYADFIYGEILDFFDKIDFKYSHSLKFLT
ncbi:MAG: hypothetical protein HQK54_03325 [Oligoflexales bacterium]|nr:hypothetical protein [Oligoflexales bacterium]